jgi:hypothetical protein
LGWLQHTCQNDGNTLACNLLNCTPAAAAAGPEPGLMRDPTSGWLQHTCQHDVNSLHATC